MSTRTIVVVLLALLLAAGGGRSEINVVDSLEWMTLDTPLIIRGKVTGVEDITVPGKEHRELTVAVAEVLKGDVKDKELTLALNRVGDDLTGKAWKASGREYLFFLRKGTVEDRPLAEKWVPRVPSDERRGVIDLTEPKGAYTADMKFAADGQAVLKIVRDWAKRKGPTTMVGEPNVFKPQVGFLRLEVPGNAEIFRDVYSGSVCYINVPASEDRRALVMQLARSQRVEERIRAAEMLRNYPGEETLKLLGEMTSDPAERVVHGKAGRIERIDYPVRQAALSTLGQFVPLAEQPAVAGSRAPTPQETVKAVEEFWEGKSAPLLPAGWTVTYSEVSRGPAGWTRITGDVGRAFHVPFATVNETEGELVVFVMPLDYGATNDLDRPEKLRDGRYAPPADMPPDRKDRPAHYVGTEGSRQVFAQLRRRSAWADPYDPAPGNPYTLLAEHLNLEISNAFVAATPVRAITLTSRRGKAVSLTTFLATGWVEIVAGAADPSRPPTDVRRARADQRHLQAVWQAAVELAQETLARQDKPPADAAQDYDEVRLTLAGKPQCVLVTPAGKDDPERKVQALRKLLQEKRYTRE